MHASGNSGEGARLAIQHVKVALNVSQTTRKILRRGKMFGACRYEIRMG